MVKHLYRCPACKTEAEVLVKLGDTSSEPECQECHESYMKRVWQVGGAWVKW